nr:uncharacterized protein LOC102150068 isoform X4 [Equus caballus]
MCQRLEQVTILQRREKGLELSPPLKRIGVELPSKVTAKNQENNFLSFDEHNYKGIMAEVWPGMCTPPTDGSGWSALLCPKFSIYLGGISEQSLPSPKKRRPSCRLWSGDARESRKKRGFGCAPCPWLAEAGGISEQSLPSPKKRRPSCRLWSGDARESRKKRGFGCAPCPWLAEAGGISEQSLPSPKKRRPSCRLWSGDARESRKKRGFGCAPCPWVAEAGGRAVQSSLPPTDRRRPFVSRDERRCEAVAAEVWPGMRTTPSDGPGRHGRSEGPLPLERTGTGTGTTPGVRIWEPWHLGVLPLTA